MFLLHIRPQTSSIGSNFARFCANSDMRTDSREDVSAAEFVDLCGVYSPEPRPGVYCVRRMLVTNTLVLVRGV